MNTTTQTVKAKIAKFIYKNLAVNVVKASSHPLLCKLNLHNNTFLKNLNAKAGVTYRMSYKQNELIEESFDCGGEDNVENALLAILNLIRAGKYKNHNEYVLKRIDYLTSVALSSIYDRNHAEWVQRIHDAIQSASKQSKSPRKAKAKPAPTTLKRKTARNKKGQFIKQKKHSN